MKFKPTQKTDLARLALHDGGILAWDKGLGKTLGMYSWCLLKCGLQPGSVPAPAAPCLLVAPGDLHDQVADDARQLLKAETVRINSQDDFLRLSTLNPLTGERVLPPGFYITSYTALASNGVAKFPVPAEHGLAAMLDLFHVTTECDDFYAARGSIYADEYEELCVGIDATWEQLESAHRVRRRNDPTNAGRAAIDQAFDVLQHLHPRGRKAGRFEDLSVPQRQWVQWETITRLSAEYSANIGETRRLQGPSSKSQVESSEPETCNLNPEPCPLTPHESPVTSHHKVKCVYSASLSDLSCESFKAVAVDEGVKMKGDETLVGLGLRQMRPPYRLVLSGTPIKNRLPDIFQPAAWATGGHDEPTARWPYGSSLEEKQAFSEEFLLAERNLTKEQASENGRRYVKLSPQVCNIHLLWKIFGPIILRRLKKDIGSELVAKHRHVVRVPMGRAQARTYRYHMMAKYTDLNGMKAVGAQLQALRTVAAAPHCANLQRRPLPDNSRDVLTSDFVSSESYIPKYAAALTIVQQVLARGQQIVLFSDLLEPLHSLSARLREAGVPHLVATGEMSPARRRKLSADFKQGPPQFNSTVPASQLYPVLLASDCMAEGHSWHLANNIAHLSFSWALDKLSQAIDRCHRLNSVLDLNYYALLCNGTTDRIVENNLHEKTDTADLVLDGQLLDTNPTEVGLGEILRSAAAEFNAEEQTIDEQALEKEWPALREQLRDTYKRWAAGEIAGTLNVESSMLEVPRSVFPVPSSEPAIHHPPSTPVIPLPSTLHPWQRRHLERRNIRQLQLAFA